MHHDFIIHRFTQPARNGGVGRVRDAVGLGAGYQLKKVSAETFPASSSSASDPDSFCLQRFHVRVHIHDETVAVRTA